LRLIDTHHHILPPFYVQALGADAIAAGLGGVPAWSPETSLAAMDRYGIDAAVASISNPGIAVNDRKKAAALARQCNDFAKEMSVQHPGRFDAFAVLPMPDVDASLAEIKRALDDLRLAGIGLLTNYLGAYLGDPNSNLFLRSSTAAKPSYSYIPRWLPPHHFAHCFLLRLLNFRTIRHGPS